jgi:hypothetical protein
MADPVLPRAQILALLAAAPPRLAALTAGLPPERLHTAPTPEDWSANDILAHLRACADMWGGAIDTILAQDHPAFKAINPRTWIQRTDYLSQAFEPALQAFTEQRARLLAVLEALPPADWERAATVAVAGKPYERTVQYYAQWLATHERSHVKQIARLVQALRPHV